VSAGRLDLKYRPTSFDDVVGHSVAIDRLKRLIANRGCQAFLFAGPSGVGKTTLARLVAKELGANKYTTTDVDGATDSRVEDMRRIKETLIYSPFFGTQRAVILDECHRLSDAAWDSLLKSIEEPPEHMAAWLFTTTAATGIPETIRSRCQLIRLWRVSDHDLGFLLDRICASEQIKLSDDERRGIIDSARGSPRVALRELQPFVVSP